MSDWQTIDTCDTGEEEDVLVYCSDTGEQFVAYRYSNPRGLFCYAIHRGTFIMCKPSHWRRLPAPPRKDNAA